MATVREWFDGFATALIERSGRLDLPEGGSEYWDDFERGLVRIGATREQADEASSIVCDLPNLFPNQYRPMIVEAIRKIQARLQAESHGAAPGSPEEARLASRGCPDCGGSGGAIRYVHADILRKVRTIGGHVAPVGAGVCYPCSCPLGRSFARGLRAEGQARDPLTVDQYPSLRLGPVAWSDSPDNRYRHRPSAWDAATGRPHHAGEVVSLDALKDSLAASKRHRGRFVPPPPREAHQEDASGLPGHADWAATIDDPEFRRVLGRGEPARPAQPAEISIPEDQAASGWF
jgi:hypothetical protein